MLSYVKFIVRDCLSTQRTEAACFLILGFTMLVPSAANAQPYGVGDTVKCYGYVGTIVRTEPRPGREPFSIVKSQDVGSTSGELRCFQKDMTSAAPPVSLIDRCRPGTKVEAAWGISWHEATVLSPPNNEQKCKVHFDGYPALYDAFVSSNQLRARGSGQIVRPTNPVRETEATQAALPAQPPDGVYQCHKILSGGQLGHTGTLTLRGGRGTVQGMPAGWNINAVTPRQYNDRGQLVVAVDYVSARGTSDRMDCVLK